MAGWARSAPVDRRPGTAIRRWPGSPGVPHTVVVTATIFRETAGWIAADIHSVVAMFDAATGHPLVPSMAELHPHEAGGGFTLAVTCSPARTPRRSPCSGSRPGESCSPLSPRGAPLAPASSGVEPDRRKRDRLAGGPAGGGWTRRPTRSAAAVREADIVSCLTASAVRFWSAPRSGRPPMSISSTASRPRCARATTTSCGAGLLADTLRWTLADYGDTRRRSHGARSRARRSRAICSTLLRPDPGRRSTERSRCSSRRRRASRPDRRACDLGSLSSRPG